MVNCSYDQGFLQGMWHARNIAWNAAFSPGGRDTAWEMIDKDIKELQRELREKGKDK